MNAQHVTPDGVLALNVKREGEETILRFNSFAWNTSGEFLGSKWSVSREEAVARFIDELLDNRAIIAVAYVGAAIRDVWVTDLPASELKYRRHEETIVFRFWNGARWDLESEGADTGE